MLLRLEAKKEWKPPRKMLKKNFSKENMNKLIIVLFIICFQQVNSQNTDIQVDKEINIQTKFVQYGSLRENIKNKSLSIAQFNKGQKCIVIGYYGKNQYKIIYKKWIGYVTSKYLDVNDQMKDVVKRYKEIQKQIVPDDKISEEENKISKREQGNDIQAKADEEARIKVEVKAKVKADEEAKIMAAAEAKAKTDEEARMKLIAEAKAIANEERQKQIELEKQIQKEKNRIADSIAKVTDSTTKVRKSCSYQINEIDPYYNFKIIKTESYRVNSDLQIELFKNSNNKYVFINYNDSLGCASYFTNNRSSAKIKLENNEIITIYHTWDIDCANFSLKGILSDSAMLKLKESPIKSIKLQGTKGSVEIENIQYKEFFIDKLNCIE